MVAETVITGQVSKKSGRVEPLLLSESIENVLGAFKKEDPNWQESAKQFEELFKAYGKALVKTRQAAPYNKTVM